MGILVLIVLYMVVVVSKSKTFIVEKDSSTSSAIDITNGRIKSHNFYAPNVVTTNIIKDKIVKIVYSDNIKISDIDRICGLLLELNRYQDTSGFLDTHPIIHSVIFGGRLYYG